MPLYPAIIQKNPSILNPCAMTKQANELPDPPCIDCPLELTDCVYCQTCKLMERYELRLLSDA